MAGSFLLISDEHIVKQSKKSMLQNTNILSYQRGKPARKVAALTFSFFPTILNIFIYYLKFIYNDLLKIFNVVGNLMKKCGHHDLLLRRIAKVGRKVGSKKNN